MVKMDRNNIINLTLVVLFLALVIGLFVRADQSAKLHVQQICDQSHRTVSGTLEKQCGEAQDRYHAEYLCNGNQPDAFCWVELK